MKRYMNAAQLYAILAMVGGVFYREFTKFQGLLKKIKPKSDYPLKTLYPRAFQTGQNHLIYYDFTTVE